MNWVSTGVRMKHRRSGLACRLNTRGCSAQNGRLRSQALAAAQNEVQHATDEQLRRFASADRGLADLDRQAAHQAVRLEQEHAQHTESARNQTARATQLETQAATLGWRHRHEQDQLRHDAALQRQHAARHTSDASRIELELHRLRVAGRHRTNGSEITPAPWSCTSHVRPSSSAGRNSRSSINSSGPSRSRQNTSRCDRRTADLRRRARRPTGAAHATYRTASPSVWVRYRPGRAARPGSHARRKASTRHVRGTAPRARSGHHALPRIAGATPARPSTQTQPRRRARRRTFPVDPARSPA